MYTNDTTASSALEWPLHYAARGWTSFPLNGETKVSYTWRGTHGPERWGASKDPDTLRDHFAPHPNAGIGLPTGYENGFWVIETDTKNGKDGEAELAKLQAQHGPLPDTYRVRSPSGSIHHYFLHPGPDFFIKSTANEVAPGIDVRGDEGMVVAPPTERGGKRYEVENNVHMAKSPDWLLAITARKITDEEKRFVKHAPPTDEPTVKPWEIAKLERYVRAALEKNEDWFAVRENALNTVWGIKRAGYGREGYRIAQIICETFAETQHVARVDRFWNDRGANKGTVSLDSFWKHCVGIGIKQTPEELAEWRKDEREHMFDDIIAANQRGEIWSPPLAPPGPLPDGTPMPGPCDLEDYDDEPPKGIRHHRIDAATLEGKPLPDREWLVRDLIPAKNVTLLYGDGATGKSLLALQLAAAVVTGTHFFGRLVAQGRVEFITAEDSLDEMHRRLAAIVHAGGGSLGAMTGLHLTSLAEADALLAVPTDSRGGALAATALYGELEGVLAESLPAVVFLDTLADVYGGNEIVRSQVRQFIGMLRRLALRYGCTIIVLAHPSLAGMEKGTSGSTGWSNSVRSRIYLKRIHEKDGRESDEDARVLSVEKLNYGRVGLEISMRWQAGVFVPVSIGPTGDPMVAAAKAERVFVELLRKYIAQNRYVSTSEGKSSAPFIFAKEAAVQGISKSALKDAMERLLAKGIIENAPHGAPSKKMFRLYVST